MNRYYNVKPRYSGGSPAQVNFETATKVVDDEKQFYDFCVRGYCGEDRMKEAHTLGLGGIVEDVTERADCWHVTDMMTGDRFVRMFPQDVDNRKKRDRLSIKYRLQVR